MNIEKLTNILTVIIAPILLFGCFVAPSLTVLSFWLTLIVISFGALGLITNRYFGLEIRKNYSIVVASVSASIATYFATNGVFPPISLLFALIFILNVMVFINLKKVTDKLVA